MPSVAPAMRRARVLSRWSGTRWPRRIRIAPSITAFSQPDSDEASAMPTWASEVPNTNQALSATLTRIDTIAV